ncbi:DNA (cytosine-5-)-methyltransferase [Planktothrix pseudagardhii]|uniref:DNA (cytosine-5-)-methyltransferase n=1 Tax=Planktothrix pseudagardhii TaxID=132604 RepID=A0A9W4CN41_9CYAN|nr:DNA (cytosine-5-)-methyltransferase [Planktothrix pseudagardhii]CAD5964766.1 Modification methylase BanI [Planktothrix pseudagardhii]
MREKKEGFGDTRGTLFFEIMRLIDTNKPQIMILENVRGIQTNDQGRTLKTIEYEITKRGYSFQFFLLNSCNFGLPQNRLRAYMIGVLEKSPKLNIVSDCGPPDSHSYSQQLSLFQQHQFSCVKTILEDNPDPKYDCSPVFIERLKHHFKGDLDKLHGKRLIDYRGGNSIHSWELGLKGECSPEEIELMNRFILKRRNKEFGDEQDGKLLTQEQIATFFNAPNLDDILQGLVDKKYLKMINNQYKPASGNFSFEVYKFLDPESIAVTLVASDANKLGIYHQGRVRRITPREAARLQGFPDHFNLHYNDDKAYYQLGNSVSINVIEFIAKEVLSKVLLSEIYLLTHPTI